MHRRIVFPSPIWIGRWLATIALVSAVALLPHPLDADETSPEGGPVPDIPSLVPSTDEMPSPDESMLWPFPDETLTEIEENTDEAGIVPSVESEESADGTGIVPSGEDEEMTAQERVTGSSRGGSRPSPASTPSAATSQPSAAPAGTVGDRIASIALKYKGYPYAWAGNSPRVGFDCSGFVGYVCKEAGVPVPEHDLAGQKRAGPAVARDKLQPGDLVFFQNTYKGGLSHGGVYLGNGRFIHAVDESKGVQITNLGEAYWATRYLGASRPWDRGSQ